MKKNKLKLSIEKACVIKSKIKTLEEELKKEMAVVDEWFSNNPDECVLTCSKGVIERTYRNEYSVVETAIDLPKLIQEGYVEKKEKQWHSLTPSGRKNATSYPHAISVARTNKVTVVPSSISWN